LQADDQKLAETRFVILLLNHWNR